MDIGIDLGTTYSVLAVKGQPDLAPGCPPGMHLPECDVTILPTPLGEHTIPSVYWADAADPANALVGAEAKQKAEEGDAPIMFSKRSIGTKTQLKMHDRTLTAREVATHMLRQFKAWAEQALGQPVRRAVITHPAYFDRNQVEETRLAAVDAGFDMDLPEQMMMEPAAASLAYVKENTKDPLLVLTYDLGGGTFDVTVVERSQGVIHLRAFDGDHLLGGYNFDRRLVDWVLEKLAAQKRTIPYDEDSPDDRARRVRLLQIAEQVKLKLYEQRTDAVPVPVKVLDVLVDADGKNVNFQDRITRKDYGKLMKEFLDETVACSRRALAKAGVEADALDHVLLVGGSTYGQWVAEAVEEAFPGKVQSFSPDLCVAAGAALRAATLPAIAAAGGVEVVIDARPTSVLPQTTISGRVQGERGRPLDVAGRTVKLHTPDGVLTTQPGTGGAFVFDDVALADGEPTEFTVEVTDPKSSAKLSKAFTVTYTPEGGTEAITTSLPKTLFVKVAEGLQLLAEEGTELPRKVEVTLQRIGNESSMEVPIYQADSEVGTIRVDNIPPDAGDGAKVVITVEITEKNSMRGTLKILARGGSSVAKEQAVNIVFPPIEVPTLAELQARFDELEQKREQDAHTAADAEHRLLLTGKGAKKSRQVGDMLQKPTADQQEVWRAMKELEKLVNPPADDMSPPQAEFRGRVEDCRDLLRARGTDPQAAPLVAMLDRIEADGTQAATTKNHKRWGLANENLNDFYSRLKKGGGPDDPPPPPPTLPATPVLKDYFQHEASGLRRQLADAWRRLEQDAARFAKNEGTFRGRRKAVEAELDQLEAAINKVADNLPSEQALAQLQLAMRPRPKIERNIKELGEVLRGSGG